MDHTFSTPQHDNSGLCPDTIFAFQTAQNYELNARGNHLLEICEFWACSVISLTLTALHNTIVQMCKNQ